MSMAVQSSDDKTQTMLLPQRTVWDWVDNGLAMASLAVAIIALILYVSAALSFYNQPFVGALLARDLTVRYGTSFGEPARSDSEDLTFWSAQAAGIRAGDKLVGINGQPFATDDPLVALEEALAEQKQGNAVLLTVDRSEGGIPNTGRWTACVPAGEATRCQVQVTLGKMPFLDFIGHFGVGAVMAILTLIITGYVFLRRPQSRASKYFLTLGGMFAVLLAGSFDFVSTHEYVYLWILGACMTAGALVTFSLEFPNTLAITERYPYSRYVPLLIGLLVSYPVYTLYLDSNSLSQVVPVALGVVGALIMMGVMVWRRQYTYSPILREQASYGLIGAAASFGAAAILLAVQYFFSDDVPTGILQAVQIISILFVLSAAYALLQNRLLDTDRLIPSLVIYGVLGGGLVLAYLAVVVGLSLLGIRGIRGNNPLLIALLAITVTLTFVPVQNFLRERIDKLMFKQRRLYRDQMEEFVNSLTNAINLQDVELTLRTQLNDMLAPNDMVIFVRDTESQMYRARPNPETHKPVTDVTFALDSGMAQHLEKESSILYIQEGKGLPPSVYKDRGRLAVLNMPIWVRLKGQRHLNGFIAIDSRRNNVPYNYEELRFIERIADQVALALERSQIVEDLEQRFKVQDVLSQVSRALNFAIDLDTMMELVYAQTSRVIESDIFSIAIVDKYSNELNYAFFVKGDERLESMEKRRWKMGRDLVSEVARSRKPIITDDYIVELRKYDPTAKPQFPDMKAWMAVPLTTARDNETLGVMVIGSTDPNVQYSEEQRNLFLDIANLASNAIDKTRLFQATQIRTQQLEALNDISSQLSYQIEDVDRLLDLITSSAIDILKVEAGSLLLLDDSENELIFRVAIGPTGQLLVGKRIGIDEKSLAAEAFKNSNHVIVNDANADTRWHGEVIDEPRIEEEEENKTFHSRAILTVPLIAQGEAIGVLQMINKKDISNFTEEDAQLLTTFAAQAAVAIQNARLFASQDQQLLQRVGELDRMAEIDQSLNQTLELNRVIDITLTWAIRQSGGTAGMLAIIDPVQEALILVGAKNYPEGSFFHEKLGTIIPSDKGLWSRAIRSRTPVYTRDVSTDPDYLESYPNASSQIVIPIISANDVIGVLLVESDDENALTLLDMQFLSRLADHASPAITNAQLFEQLNRQQSQRAEFVSFIAHELKAPMTSMKGYTDLLMRGVVGPLNQQQQDFLHTIYNAVNRMDGLVSDLRDIETYEAGQMRLDMAEVDIKKIISDSAKPLSQQFEDKEQTLVLELPDDLPTVWADERRLVQIMTNFLTNANKYTPEGGTVTVKCERTANKWDNQGARQVVHIQVRDTGIGISEADQKKIFREKYYRTENPDALEQPGTGLGMVLTRGLILQHGGSVWVESVIKEGTTFHFTIPLADEIMRQAM